MKTIYDLELHEELKLILEYSPLTILRVPGGWTYTEYHNEKTTTTFVPYNDEFNPKAKPQPEDYTEDPPEDTLK